MSSSSSTVKLRPMYRVRPYFEIKKVKLPDCMYMTRSLHQVQCLAPTNEGASSALSYLEQRQERTLTQLSQLQERVKRLIEERLGSDTAQALLLQGASGTSSSHCEDVVISCPPSSPPYFLLALYKFISGRVPSACSAHVHSSTVHSPSSPSPPSLPSSKTLMRCFFDDVMKKETMSTDASSSSITAAAPQGQGDSAQFKLTLIWKAESICSGVTMLVAPHKQTPVEGMASVCRYLCRCFCQDLYEGEGGEIRGRKRRDIVETAQIDSWLDLVSYALSFGSSKEKQSVLRQMNSHLGTSSYLVGDSVSLADLVAYATLCASDSGGLKPGKNVKEWLRRCSSTDELSVIPCPFLTDEQS